MSGIFKAYDIRGIYPDELDEDIARKVGLAFRAILDDAGPAHGGTGRRLPRHALPQRAAGRRP